MVTEKIQELAALQAKAAKLQAAIESQRTSELAALPANYGYASLIDFIKALKAAVSSGRRGRRGAKAKVAKPAKKSGGKRKRAKITSELKSQVKSAVEAGKTGAAIAKEFGISVPSVQNIKKELGLVKKRG
jgi:DNA invertase Pin-like site-specific DNA recombinase